MLPKGYTRVEYIESTGTQYIDTGFKPNQDTRIEIDADIITAVSAYTVFGTWDASYTNAFAVLGTASIKSRYYYGSKYADGTASVLGRHKFKVDRNLMYIDGNLGATVAESDFECSYPLFLSGFNNAGTPRDANWTSLKAYAGTIHDKDSKVRDYIPFIDASNDANLWDDINSSPAEKVGTFLYGPALVPEALTGLTRVESSAGIAFSWEASEYANEYIITRDGTQIADVYGDITSYTDTNITPGKEYTYTVTPYNGIQAGTSSSLAAQSVPAAPVELAYTLDGNAVTLTWSTVEFALRYRIYANGTQISETTDTTYTDAGLIAPAVREYTVTAINDYGESEPSKSVRVAYWGDALPDLITDRTAADVAEAKRLRDKLIAGEALTDDESSRYFAGLRGCYNASDMNRVGAAVRYVADRLNAEGYGAYVEPKTDWQMEDIVRQSDWNKYLDEVRHLRRKLTLMRTTPQITDGMYSGLKSYAEANAIEQILVDLDWMLTNIIRNYIYAGEVFAGEV